MTSVNNNSSGQSATATSTAAATAQDVKGSSAPGAKNARQPRGTNIRKDGKKNDRKCDHCGKNGHLKDKCYVFLEQENKRKIDEQVAMAANVATTAALRTMREFMPAGAAPIAASAAPAKAEAAVLAEGTDSDDDDNDSWFDAPEDVVDVVGIGAAEEDGFEDAEDAPPEYNFFDGLLTPLDVFGDLITQLEMALLWFWSCLGALAGFCVRQIGCLFRKKMVFTESNKLISLDHGDDDAFLQVFRGVDYMMRVLFFVLIVPYFAYAAWSYYVIAQGTDRVVTYAVLKYCDRPETALNQWESVGLASDVAGMRAFRSFGDAMGGKVDVGCEIKRSAAGWIPESLTNFFTGRPSENLSCESESQDNPADEPKSEEPWHRASESERLRRIFTVGHPDNCGMIAPVLLTYARAVIYGMALLIALFYVGLVSYNFPKHNRPDSVRYTLVGPHDFYNHHATLGDHRDPSFRSAKADSSDFVINPDYLEYDVVQVVNNVMTKRRVVISHEIFKILNSPLNTGRWNDVKDLANLRKDTAAFARAACQRVNIDPSVELRHDMLNETANLFAWSLLNKRTFLVNFGTPKIE